MMMTLKTVNFCSGQSYPGRKKVRLIVVKPEDDLNQVVLVNRKLYKNEKQGQFTRNWNTEYTDFTDLDGYNPYSSVKSVLSVFLFFLLSFLLVNYASNKNLYRF